MMNKIKLGAVAAAVLMALTTSAFAGTSEGPYVGAGISAYSGDATVSAPGVSITFGNDKLDVGANVFGGYKWNMGTGSVAAELSYNSNVGKLANLTGAGQTIDGKLDNNWAISVLPGYNFTKDTTGYFRLGYAQVKGTLNLTGTITGSGNHTFNGTVWGFGVDQAVTPNLAARLEYQVLDMSSWTSGGTSVKPRATGMNLSLRYGF